jgi:hypothetical protein
MHPQGISLDGSLLAMPAAVRVCRRAGRCPRAGEMHETVDNETGKPATVKAYFDAQGAPGVD